MYNKILLPTDGSEGSEAALEHALDLAGKYDAELHILFVADIRVDSPNDIWANVLGQLEEIGEEATSEIAKKVEENDIEVVKEVMRGIPYKKINSYTEENDIDLIAMGTHGRTGVDRLLIGSVTEKVIRTSEKPVLTVGRNGE
jgi:nucleotide-binding universal stress UspA family protein